MSPDNLSEPARLKNAPLAEPMKPEAVACPLETPNDAFNGLKPVEVIERGQVGR